MILFTSQNEHFIQLIFNSNDFRVSNKWWCDLLQQFEYNSSMLDRNEIDFCFFLSAPTSYF